MFEFLYYLGIASCGIQGAKRSITQYGLSLNRALLCGYTNSFFGGIVRDVGWLFVFPVAFTMGCVPDIIVALLGAAIYYIAAKYRWGTRIIDLLAKVGDCCGLGAFLALGADRAYSFGAPLWVVLVCSWSTALLGGITCSLLCGRSLHSLYKDATIYRVIAAFGGIIYICCLNSEKSIEVAHYFIILYTVILVPLCDSAISRKKLRNAYVFLGKSLLYTTISWRLDICIKGNTKRALDLDNLSRLQNAILKFRQMKFTKVTWYYCVRQS